MSSVTKMSFFEIRTSLFLASVYSLRMLGMFLILPIFAIYASGLSGSPSQLQIGIALGVYGLTQAAFQIPFGMSSDLYGRKKVIYFGLAIFVLGSIIAGASTQIEGIIIGRAIQGAGAISAVLTALLSDLTRDEHRTKAMAIVGASIGLTFALSLVISPWLNDKIGVSGIFFMMGILSILAAIVIHLFVHEPKRTNKKIVLKLKDFYAVLWRLDLGRLNLGIFVLHVAQISMFMVVPFYLIQQGNLPLDDHWMIYLPILLGSFILIIPIIIFSEKLKKTKLTFLLSILILLAAQFSFIYFSNNLVGIMISLLIYFVGFNFLEASLPSLVSRMAPANQKGLALGVYNTSQSLGIFVGGFVGGLITTFYGYSGTFIFCGVLIFIWFVFSLNMNVPIKKS
jgi:MFS family permease